MYRSIAQSSIVEKSHSDLFCKFEKMFRVNSLLRAANVKKANPGFDRRSVKTVKTTPETRSYQ